MTRQTFVDLPAQPVRNRCANPSFEGGVVTGWGVSGPCTTSVAPAGAVPAPPSGTRALQVVATGYAGPYFSAYSDPGGLHAYAPWVYSPVAQDFTVFASQSQPLGGAASVPGTKVTAVPANVWTRLAPIVGQVPAVETRTNWIVRGAGASTWYLDAAMAAPNVLTLPAYADGDTPGWRWLAGAHNSESVGWPRGLGQPDLCLDGRYPLGYAGAPVDGQAVATWTDLSVWGNHFTQATAGARPTWDAARAAVMFNGVNQYLDSTLLGMTQPYTVYLVAFATGQTGANYQSAWDGTTDHSTVFFRDAASPVRPITSQFWEINAGGTSITNGTPRDLSVPQVVTAVFSSPTGYVAVNGRGGSGPAGAISATPRVRVGAANVASYFKGGIKAVWAYRGAHTPTERLAMETRLAALYGVTYP